MQIKPPYIPTKAEVRKEIRRLIRHQEIALANIAAIERHQDIPLANGNDLKPGEIYLANESVFTQNYFDQPLTTYAVGWRDPNDIERTLEFFAPATPAARRFTYKEWNNIEEFLSEGANDDLRAIGGEFPTVRFTGTETHARTDNRGLRIRVDLDEVADPTSALAGGLPAYQARTVDKLMRRLRRNSLRRAISLISAASVNTAKTWDTTAGKDPDMDIINEGVLGATASGIQFNRVGYGHTAATKRLLSLRAQNTPAGYSGSLISMDQLAGLLQVDQTYVSKERFSAAGAALAEIVANLVLMFYAVSGADVEDPSNIKRFVSMTDSGGPYRVYVQQVTGKLVDITVEHYELIKITSTLGMRKFTVS